MSRRRSSNYGGRIASPVVCGADVVVSPVWMTVLVSYKTKPSTITMAMMPPTMAPPLHVASRVGPEFQDRSFRCRCRDRLRSQLEFGPMDGQDDHRYRAQRGRLGQIEREVHIDAPSEVPPGQPASNCCHAERDHVARRILIRKEICSGSELRRDSQSRGAMI